MKEAIRLTNKTAIALRKSAQKVRTAYFAAMVILSVLLGALGIFLGFVWLPAVPLMIAAIALMDCALTVASRSRYLSLLGQAICTEAAAREIQAGSSQKKRREQAIHDLMRMKEDIHKPSRKGETPDTQPFFEKKADNEEDKQEEMPEAPPRDQEQETPRRRRQKRNLQLIKSEQAK